MRNQLSLLCPPSWVWARCVCARTCVCVHVCVLTCPLCDPRAPVNRLFVFRLPSPSLDKLPRSSSPPHHELPHHSPKKLLAPQFSGESKCPSLLPLPP